MTLHFIDCNGIMFDIRYMLLPLKTVKSVIFTDVCVYASYSTILSEYSLHAAIYFMISPNPRPKPLQGDRLLCTTPNYLIFPDLLQTAPSSISVNPSPPNSVSRVAETTTSYEIWSWSVSQGFDC